MDKLNRVTDWDDLIGKTIKGYKVSSIDQEISLAFTDGSFFNLSITVASWNDGDLDFELDGYVEDGTLVALGLMSEETMLERSDAKKAISRNVLLNNQRMEYDRLRRIFDKDYAEEVQKRDDKSTEEYELARINRLKIARAKLAKMNLK